MDEQLERIIQLLHKQNDLLGKARFEYLDMEATRKFHEATMVQRSLGKSHAEKLTNAQSQAEWLEFHKKLARLEAIFEFEKLKLEVLTKEFLAIHLTLKLDSEMLKKG